MRRFVLALVLAAGVAHAGTVLEGVEVVRKPGLAVRLHLSDPVQATARTLPAEGNRPARVYLDLPDTTLGAAAPALVSGAESLARVRTGQFDATTVRVVLDLVDPVGFDVNVQDRTLTIALAQSPATSRAQPELVPVPSRFERELAARPEVERPPVVSRAEPERTPIAPQAEPERAVEVPRTDPERVPVPPRLESERAPVGHPKVEPGPVARPAVEPSPVAKETSPIQPAPETVALSPVAVPSPAEATASIAAAAPPPIAVVPPIEAAAPVDHPEIQRSLVATQTSPIQPAPEAVPASLVALPQLADAASLGDAAPPPIVVVSPNVAAVAAAAPPIASPSIGDVAAPIASAAPPPVADAPPAAVTLPIASATSPSADAAPPTVVSEPSAPDASSFSVAAASPPADAAPPPVAATPLVDDAASSVAAMPPPLAAEPPASEAPALVAAAPPAAIATPPAPAVVPPAVTLAPPPTLMAPPTLLPPVAAVKPPPVAIVPEAPTIGRHPRPEVREVRRPWLVVLDAGHGGHDPGATGLSGVYEKTITLDIAQRVAARLAVEIPVEVMLTRSDDRFLPIEDRVARAAEASLFVSLHANAGDPALNGVEVFYGGGGARAAAAGPGSPVRLGLDVVEAIERTLGDVRTTVRPGAFGVLTRNTVPSVLVEIGYLTNPTDAARIADDTYLTQVAQAIADGAAAFLRDPTALAAR
jgi:N-acetylmuramoyl-L-alanine amidase